MVLLKVMSFTRSNPLHASGPLLGIISKSGDTLEVSNCFLFATDDADSSDYALSMLRHLREVNMDHLQVGWFQASTPLPFMTEDFVYSQVGFQQQLPQAVVLVFDTVRSTQGSIALKAFRLSDRFLELMVEADFTLERLKEVKKSDKFGFEDLLEELPVVLRSSQLASALIEDLRADASSSETFDHLDLSTHQYLEQHVRSLMDCVDELSNETQRYHNYQRSVARQEQQRAEAEKRGAGEEELAAVAQKAVQPFSCLETLLITSQIARYSQQISQFASQSFGKLYVAQGLQTSL